ncbi:glyoxalase [Williamsia sp. Leaf354]|uniref:VOC family protein n=1 Tax=Williamsia sp. Leaf354 TaxID=1736349 RepID=UPI0006FBDF17|nr:VOC family protein [Williamsia sp. Leaf354]KQS00668.1 glyoxalase [Williamsia sp. Leaf354]
MTARFNHTIIAANDPEASARFHRHILEADDAPRWGPFINLTLDGGVLLQFAAPPTDFSPQHYAFLVTEDHFDRALDYMRHHELDYWADPQRRSLHATNTEHGGRGVYFLDPAGHYLELTTRPYV